MKVSPVVVVAELVSASEHAAESSGDASRAHGAERVALIAGRSRVLGRLEQNFRRDGRPFPERRVSSADGRGVPRAKGVARARPSDGDDERRRRARGLRARPS